MGTPSAATLLPIHPDAWDPLCGDDLCHHSVLAGSASGVALLSCFLPLVGARFPLLACPPKGGTVVAESPSRHINTYEHHDNIIGPSSAYLSHRKSFLESYTAHVVGLPMVRCHHKGPLVYSALWRSMAPLHGTFYGTRHFMAPMATTGYIGSLG